MLDQIQGKILHIDTHFVTLEIHGMGLKVHIPEADLYNLQLGQISTLYTALFFKEPQFELYGFLQREKRECFYLLNSVNGIGPKTALHVLSAFPLNDLFACIHREDAAALAKVPGVGKKTAGRVILEMKSKVPQVEDSLTPIHDALLALKKLGFQESLAKKVLDDIYKKNPTAQIDELITLSLQHLS